MKKPVVILCIDDNQWDREAFGSMVHAKELPYEITYTATLADARTRLLDGHFDIILAANRLPDGDGFQLGGETNNPPCILLANTAEEQSILRTQQRESDLALLKDAQGRYLELIPFLIDQLLRRKQLQETEMQLTEKLLENEELRRLAEEAAGVGSFDLNLQTGEIRVSPEWLAIYGEKPDSMPPPQDEWLRRVHPDDVKKVEAAIQSFHPEGPPWSCEFRIFRPNGEIRWIEARARSTFDAEGNLTRTVGVNVDITDRKNSQEAMQESEMFYRTLIETLPVTVVLADREGKVTYISPAVQEMFGLAPAEGLGTHPTDWIAPEHHEVVYDRMRKVMLDLQPQPPIEYKMFKRDGAAIWASLASTPILDLQGRLKGVITVCQDITDRKLAEDAMRENEERMRMVLQASTTGWWVWDLTDNQVTADAQAKALFGFPPEKVVDYDAFIKVFAPEEIPRVLRKLPAFMASDEDFDSEFHLIWPDGSSHWIQAKGHAFSDQSGKTRRVMGLVMDITARKRVEVAFQRTLERLEILSEVASQLLTSSRPQEIIGGLCEQIINHLDCDVFFNFLTDEKTRRLHLNACGGVPEELARQIEWLEFGEAICGYAAQLRRPVILDNLQESADPRTESLRALGITTFACYPLISRDNLIGTLSFGSKSKTAFPQEGLTLMHAISDQVAIAIERRQLMELARQSAAAADAANRAKDHFLAVLSHELRTPLTPIVMGVSLLQNRTDLDPEVCQTLEMVRRNTEMEARLIDDLLDMTRIARGKIELMRRPVELGSVIHHAVEVCKPDIEARRLHFDLDLGPEGAYWIEADVSRMQQVFWNLLKNAIKFTPHNGCVGIRCHSQEGQVVIDVNDSGIGIEPEALSRIFNAFEQEERTTTRQFGGLGLGLAISKTLVALHGGTIEARSAGRNQGATFRIRLPRIAPVKPSESPAIENSRAKITRPLRILLVEDHGITAKMMKIVLGKEGHEVETAGDIATALNMADQHDADQKNFDLLISDLGLPDGSGHDLMRELRSRGHSFPGIALSGYGQEENIRRSYEVGFSSHLTKPASREALFEVLSSVMDGQRLFGTGKSATGLPPPAAAFDAATALKQCFDDSALLNQMIQYFFSDVETILPQIRAALEKNDLVELGKLAHRMKGTLLHLGADSVGEAAAQLERAGIYSIQQAEAEEAVRGLEFQCQILKAALTEYQNAALANQA